MSLRQENVRFKKAIELAIIMLSADRMRSKNEWASVADFLVEEMRKAIGLQ
jgi:hypothetical protein